MTINGSTMTSNALAAGTGREPDTAAAGWLTSAPADLAALVEGLSEMTPARIRRFAAQICDAETLAFPGTRPEPNPEAGR